MKFQEFSYEVRAEIKLTPAEVDILRELAERHYDYKCQDASSGFLRGWANMVDPPGAVPICARFQQVDLCCKIMEQSDPDNPEHQALSGALAELARKISNESGRCNIPGTAPAFTPAEELRPLLQMLDDLIGFRDSGGTVNSGPVLRAYEELPYRIRQWARG